MFRGSVLIPVEVTLFHILSNSKMLSRELYMLSNKFFSQIIEKNTSNDDKLRVMKNFMQATGWGRVNIVSKDNDIVFIINDPPYGLQSESAFSQPPSWLSPCFRVP